MLFDLAMMGDLGGIQKEAERLKTIDFKYVPFANYLNQLAKDFEEAKILDFVQKYMGQWTYEHFIVGTEHHINRRWQCK